MRLASIAEPFNHPDWLYELKWDGWRAIAQVRGGECRIFSRNQNA
jgi:bifunctional non-homologous end joining protein LigD